MTDLQSGDAVPPPPMSYYQYYYYLPTGSTGSAYQRFKPVTTSFTGSRRSDDGAGFEESQIYHPTSYRSLDNSVNIVGEDTAARYSQDGDSDDGVIDFELYDEEDVYQIYPDFEDTHVDPSPGRDYGDGRSLYQDQDQVDIRNIQDPDRKDKFKVVQVNLPKLVLYEPDDPNVRPAQDDDYVDHEAQNRSRRRRRRRRKRKRKRPKVMEDRRDHKDEIKYVDFKVDTDHVQDRKDRLDRYDHHDHGHVWYEDVDAPWYEKNTVWRKEKEQVNVYNLDHDPYIPPHERYDRSDHHSGYGHDDHSGYGHDHSGYGHDHGYGKPSKKKCHDCKKDGGFQTPGFLLALLATTLYLATLASGLLARRKRRKRRRKRSVDPEPMQVSHILSAIASASHQYET